MGSNGLGVLGPLALRRRKTCARGGGLRGLRQAKGGALRGREVPRAEAHFIRRACRCTEVQLPLLKQGAPT